jgi:hypothetical protein
VTQILTDALKESAAFMFSVKRRIIDDDYDEGNSLLRKSDIRTTLHDVHPNKHWLSVLAVFVNGLT